VAFGLITGTERMLSPDMTYHAAAVLPLALMWVACRRGALASRTVRIVEAAGMIGTTVATAAMGHYIPPWNNPSMIVFSAVSFGWTARTIYVPSSAKRTFLLTAAAGLPLVFGAYVDHLAFDADAWRRLDPGFADVTPVRFATVAAVYMLAWWSLTVGLCTAASNVIYGLRRDIREARRLGQYTLEEKLGEGGMGVVYRARHAMLRRPTAIKLLLPERVGTNSLARFEREVQVTAELTHPNTIRIHDYGRTSDGTLYYVMELLEGADLGRVVGASGPQPPARVVHVLTQVAGALREAHERGLIHRDVKPSNIMLCTQGGVPDVAKVVDFGLVKTVVADGDATLTNPSVLTGTPLYMAPEALTDPEGLDGRSDLYSLGAVAYYLLTGTNVFEGKTLVQICAHHLHTEPEPPSKRLGAPLPEELEALVLACLAKKRDARPRDAAELLARLSRCALRAEWTETEARAWWSEWGAAMRRSSAADRTQPAVRADVQVDLADRR